jgi:hypothetical protein
MDITYRLGCVPLIRTVDRRIILVSQLNGQPVTRSGGQIVGGVAGCVAQHEVGRVAYRRVVGQVSSEPLPRGRLRSVYPAGTLQRWVVATEFNLGPVLKPIRAPCLHSLH